MIDCFSEPDESAWAEDRVAEHLPHDNNGVVVPGAYTALLNAIQSGTFARLKRFQPVVLSNWPIPWQLRFMIWREGIHTIMG